jgi:hypothetical protein
MGAGKTIHSIRSEMLWVRAVGTDRWPYRLALSDMAAAPPEHPHQRDQLANR